MDLPPNIRGLAGLIIGLMLCWITILPIIVLADEKTALYLLAFFALATAAAVYFLWPKESEKRNSWENRKKPYLGRRHGSTPTNQPQEQSLWPILFGVIAVYVVVCAIVIVVLEILGIIPLDFTLPPRF
jgi:hypothetical protein